MTENTKIEWAHHTTNFWTGCEAISPGCAKCYAATWAKRAGRDFAERKRTTAASWREPAKWNKRAAAMGVRERVFTNSLADFFDNAAPDEWRADAWEVIRATLQLDWLILTKRIGNAFHGMLPLDFNAERYPNVWIGATVVNRVEAARDIPKLLSINARVRFLSLEPLLTPIDLTPFLSTIDWVIVGAESGPQARQVDILWVTDLQRQCRAAGVPFFLKQLGRFPIVASGNAVTLRDPKGGDMAEWPESMRVREFPMITALSN